MIESRGSRSVIDPQLFAPFGELGVVARAARGELASPADELEWRIVEAARRMLDRVHLCISNTGLGQRKVHRYLEGGELCVTAAGKKEVVKVKTDSQEGRIVNVGYGEIKDRFAQLAVVRVRPFPRLRTVTSLPTSLHVLAVTRENVRKWSIERLAGDYFAQVETQFKPENKPGYYFASAVSFRFGRQLKPLPERDWTRILKLLTGGSLLRRKPICGFLGASCVPVVYGRSSTTQHDLNCAIWELVDSGAKESQGNSEALDNQFFFEVGGKARNMVIGNTVLSTSQLLPGNW